jgi:hypothetical protein
MEPEPTGVHLAIEAAIAAFAMLGGIMGFMTGLFAIIAAIQRRSDDALGSWINLGVAIGFGFGLLLAIPTFTIIIYMAPQLQGPKPILLTLLAGLVVSVTLYVGITSWGWPFWAMYAGGYGSALVVASVFITIETIYRRRGRRLAREPERRVADAFGYRRAA